MAKLDEVVVMGYGTQLKKKLQVQYQLLEVKQLKKLNQPVLSRRFRVK